MLGLEELLSDEGGQEFAHQEHPWCPFVFVGVVGSPEPNTGPKSTAQGWLVLARGMASHEGPAPPMAASGLPIPQEHEVVAGDRAIHI